MGENKCVSISKAGERSSFFDNFKLFLIVLVVLGHVFEEFGTRGNLGVIRSVTYSFHMPAFVFISGYFSKNYESACETAVARCLVPFLIFNTIFLLFFYKGSQDIINIFYPEYIFWYFLSLFFWRILIGPLMKVRFILPITVLVALYIGCIDEAGKFFSISRTLVFFPFFIMGAMCTEDIIEKIRKVPKLLCGLLLALLCGLTVYMNISGFIPVRLYESINSYHILQMGYIQGMLKRLIILAVASAMIFCIINLMTAKKTPLTKYGRNTACVYVLSGFVTFKLSSLGLSKIAGDNIVYISLISIGVTVLILLAFLNKPVTTAFNFLLKKIETIITKTSKVIKQKTNIS